MWAWSSGRAALQLHAAGAPSRALTLRFTVRTRGARKMELRQGGTILWQASLEDRFAPIVVPDLNIKSGMTSLEFVTDVPGRPEAPQAGARLLAFAVYNLAIE